MIAILVRVMSHDSNSFESQLKIGGEDCSEVLQSIDGQVFLGEALEVGRVRLHGDVLGVNHCDGESKVTC